MARRPVLGIVGSDSTTGEKDARALGALAAAAGWIVLTGGRNSGVMAAAVAGAKSSGVGLTVGILPTSDSDISDDVDVAIITDLNNARNNLVGLSSHVLVACGVDGPGTTAEVALALKNMKPVILLNASAVAVTFLKSIRARSSGELLEATSPEQALELALKYRPT